MEPLFQTEVTIDFREYLRFNHTILLNRKGWLTIFIVEILVLFAFALWAKRPWIAVVYALIILFAVSSVAYWNVKRAYKKNKPIQDLQVKYEFFEDRIALTSTYGHSELPYEKLYKIIESKTNFYFMSSPNQGEIIKKENCSEQLIAFLKQLRLAHR